MAYTKPVESWYSAVFIYSLEEAKARQITDGLSDASSASFDKNGKHLYFMASTDIGPRFSGFDMSSNPFQLTRSVYVVVLKKPILHRSHPKAIKRKSLKIKSLKRLMTSLLKSIRKPIRPRPRPRPFLSRMIRKHRHELPLILMVSASACLFKVGAARLQQIRGQPVWG
jgi:hypothetical protein